MNIKEQWIDKFEERLWEHHTRAWVEGNWFHDHPFQIAVAYFDWGIDGQPEETVDEAFTRYLETLK